MKPPLGRDSMALSPAHRIVSRSNAPPVSTPDRRKFVLKVQTLVESGRFPGGGRRQCDVHARASPTICADQCGRQAALGSQVRRFTDESRPMGGFILAEILVMVGTAGDSGTAGETLHWPVLVFLVG